MVNNNEIIFERNIFKKKYRKNQINSSNVNGSTSNNNTNSSSVNIVRKALKIPTNFDSIAAKQMSNYKHSKAQEMFKERNKKFVDESSSNGNKSNNFINTNNGQHSVCPVEYMEDGTLRNANPFENRQSGSSSTNPPFLFPSAFHTAESYQAFVPIPSFNPHIPPPILSPQVHSTSPNNLQKINNNNNNKVNSTTSKSPSSNSSNVSNKRPTPKENENVLNKVIKQEVEEVTGTNAEDDIPTFQSPPEITSTTTSTPTTTQRITKTAGEFSDDERNKQKQALLWSLCQEELTVQSSIASGTKKIDSIRKKIDNYQYALSTEEIKIQELKLKAEQLAERRKELLMSTEN